MTPNTIVTLFVIGTLVTIIAINLLYNRFLRKVEKKESFKEILANAFVEFVLFMIFLGISRLINLFR
jgi:hypothetical protein